MNVCSPSKVQGPALLRNPFQQVRSVSIVISNISKSIKSQINDTDCKYATWQSPKNKENLSPNQQRVDLVKKIIVLLEENEKSAELIKQFLTKESRYQKQKSSDKLKLSQLRDEVAIIKEQLIQTQYIHIYNLKTKYQAVLKELDYKDQQIENKKETIIAQEEHIKQLLERNAELTEQLKYNQDDLNNLGDIDEKINFILNENEQLKLLSDKLQDQLSASEELLFRFKQKIDQLQSQETERMKGHQMDTNKRQEIYKLNQLYYQKIMHVEGRLYDHQYILQLYYYLKLSLLFIFQINTSLYCSYEFVVQIFQQPFQLILIYKQDILAIQLFIQLKCLFFLNKQFKQILQKKCQVLIKISENFI
ncbi:unnamed protein product [Paramecium sonneborni]|uniref:Uncharacterized protein n=1 Tax=Paramecium sonneborni TaxID=65129 RepID=A0A8S1PXK0_9CILI|nr:unnamed protein product [Paramecium sonneborni]